MVRTAEQALVLFGSAVRTAVERSPALHGRSGALAALLQNQAASAARTIKMTAAHLARLLASSGAE